MFLGFHKSPKSRRLRKKASSLQPYCKKGQIFILEPNLVIYTFWHLEIPVAQLFKVTVQKHKLVKQTCFTQTY